MTPTTPSPISEQAAGEPIAKPNYVALARDAGLQLRIDSKFGNPNYQSVSGSWPALVKFAELVSTAPTTGSAPDAIGNEVTTLRRALSHIESTAQQSREQSRRIQWIRARALSALHGDDVWRELNLPPERDKEIGRLRRRIAELEIAAPAPTTGSAPTVITKGERDGNWQEFSVNEHGGFIRIVARMEDDDEDLPLGKLVEQFLLASPAASVLTDIMLQRLYVDARSNGTFDEFENAFSAYLAASMGGDKS